MALDAFDTSPWGTKYPPIAALWRRAWDQVIPFYAFAPDIRKIVYTTNAIESLHMQLRKIIKARGRFPSDEAALKLIWLALRNVVAKWTGSRHDWKSAMTQFALLYPERFNIGV
ncbi:transposase, mutator type [Burkholderia pseudomallei]|nr:transposase, mutator type [Burkholderia pseudomallei]VBY63042.1 transposase, mutator type [Burkholderia pseudomallei]VBY77229.1 transposase, mutator type [Burkholderia pseudomallei]VBY88217.1 transposase, mutator type [Burkholderia pseudomallei]